MTEHTEPTESAEPAGHTSHTGRPAPTGSSGAAAPTGPDRSFPVHHHPTYRGAEGLHLETLLVRAGTGTDPTTGAITTPIHLSTAYGHPGLGRSTGYDYTRTANPTRDILQDALAQLEGGTAGFALASGMAALELTVLTLAPHGSRIVALQDLYGGSFRYLEVLHEEGAYEVDFVTGIEGLRAALASPAALVVIETPTNPMMVVVVADEGLAARLNYRLNTTGATLGPFDCFLLLRGLKTLALRMERHQANARAVVDFLRGSGHVTRVLYPGYSGMVSFDLGGAVGR